MYCPSFNFLYFPSCQARIYLLSANNYIQTQHYQRKLCVYTISLPDFSLLTFYYNNIHKDIGRIDLVFNNICLAIPLKLKYISITKLKDTNKSVIILLFAIINFFVKVENTYHDNRRHIQKPFKSLIKSSLAPHMC